MSGLGRTGGFYPGPSRTGGAYPLVRRVLESLQSGRGTPWSTQPGTAVYAENMAIARCIAWDVHEASDRMANQFIPSKLMSAGLLARWEVIFGIYPLATDTDTIRKARVMAAWARIGTTNWTQPITDALTSAMGSFFVGITTTPPSSAVIQWPIGCIVGSGVGTPTTLLGTASVSGTTVVFNRNQTLPAGASLVFSSQPSTVYVLASAMAGQTSGTLSTSFGSLHTGQTVTTSPALPWYSTVRYLAIQVRVPAGSTLAQLYAAIAAVNPTLDTILPADVTWSWYGVDTTQGVQGFYLDSNSGASLSGTATIANGSPSVAFSVSQTLAAGCALVFSTQLGVVYHTTAAVSGTSATLTANYSGAGTTANATIGTGAPPNNLDFDAFAS